MGIERSSYPAACTRANPSVHHWLETQDQGGGPRLSDEPLALVLPCEFQSAGADIEPYQCRLLEALPVQHQGRARNQQGVCCDCDPRCARILGTRFHHFQLSEKITALIPMRQQISRTARHSAFATGGKMDPDIFCSDAAKLPVLYGWLRFFQAAAREQCSPMLALEGTCNYRPREIGSTDFYLTLAGVS